ncbi:MAG TPA: site-2 protease family protein [Croceibacterium sp.]|nr:site-2 protease family protein [Croceibacterium sp.]
MDGTLLNVLALAPALVFAIVFHEIAHGWTALVLGDPTAKEQRRLSLNPLRHVDPVGTLILPGLLALVGAPVFGWAKPVPVNFQRLRNPRFGMMAVAAAGPLTNLVMATLGALAIGLLVRGGAPADVSVGSFCLLALTYFVMINVFVAFFNLLPIPPFDGSHIVEGLLPPRMAQAYGKLRGVGMALFFVLVALSWFGPTSGILGHVIGPPIEWMLGRVATLVDWVAGWHYTLAD